MSGRVYERKFDWDEARRLRASGMTLKAIGDQLGVSDSAIHLACNPDAYALTIARSAEWQRGGSCIDCGAPCTRGSAARNGRCRPCAAVFAATSVRDTELLCFRCKEWQPDDAFPHNRHERSRIRRYRHNLCRACLTIAKRDWRARTKVPCSHGCGTMVDGKNRRDPNKPPECLPCANRRKNATLKAEGRLGRRAA